MIRLVRPGSARFAIAFLSVVLAGCTAGARDRRARGGAGSGAGDDGAGARGGSGEVFVSDAELAPMDAWIRRRLWILGDQVEVDASKEYFSQVVSVVARTGYVRQDISEAGGVTTTVLTFLGRSGEVDVTNAPRAMVGTGLTITARERLVMRLHKTTNPDLPVRFRLVARGRASAGSGDQVVQRGPELTLGARIRRLPGGGHAFEEQ
jgi:hypothetical protein